MVVSYGSSALRIHVDAAPEVRQILDERLLPLPARLAGEPEAEVTLRYHVVPGPWTEDRDVCGVRCEPDFVAASATIVLDATRAGMWDLTNLITIPLLTLLHHRGCYPLHAAALWRAGQLTLLTGPGGAGKSTLSLILSQHGYALLCDELTFIRETDDGLPVATIPRMKNPANKPMLSASSTRPTDVGGLSGLARIVVLFPRFDPDGPVRVEPVEMAEGHLSMIAENLFYNNHQINQMTAQLEHFEFLARLSTRTRFFNLIYNDELLRQVPPVVDLLSVGS